MGIKKPSFDIDLAAIRSQFQGLNGRHPGLWPTLPRITLLVGLVIGLLVLAYFAYWQGQIEDLERRQAEEVTLKAAFVDKMKQAVNLEILRKQKEVVSTYVSMLEKQLPSKAEMDALLSDINQAGVGRGLQFDLFKPGAVVARDYYAELPINVQLNGTYHDLGAFTSDISNLPRIVTLNNLNIQLQEKTGKLKMDAIAKTFRYLDPEEIAAQKAAKVAKPGAKPAAKSGA
ncbi:MAG: type 4a pilus biogenesis protein PilO [Burkholderiaceae bacterium]